MPEFIFTMKDLRKTVPPKREILKGIWLSFYYGAKIGVLGHNGSGKSSLLRVMAGQDDQFTGEAFPGKGATVGFLAQEPKLDPAKSVLGNVEEGVAKQKAIIDRYNALMENYSDETADEAAKLQDQIDHQNLWDLDTHLEIAMDALRCPPGDADVTTLSGGERRRVALCRLLLQKPDLLLLDEPTNHLDAESVAWLERHLKEYTGTVVAVTHDRYFLDNVAGWILELDRGAGIPWEGNYSSWLDQKQRRLAQEEKASSARQKTLEHELEWVRMAPRARHAKSKARITAYEDLLRQDTERASSQIEELYLPAGPRLGDVVVEAKDLRKGYGDNLLMENLSFSLPPGGVVGVIGPNGAGKTTLFRMIVGQEKPDGGTLRVGETVALSYVDQSRDVLEGEQNVWQAISEGRDLIQLGKREVPSRAYVSWFNFKGSDQQKLVKDLSGGERRRVALCKLLIEQPDLLLLDEPTAGMSAQERRATGELLSPIKQICSLLIVEHDLDFIRDICDSLTVLDQGQVVASGPASEVQNSEKVKEAYLSHA